MCCIRVGHRPLYHLVKGEPPGVADTGFCLDATDNFEKMLVDYEVDLCLWGQFLTALSHTSTHVTFIRASIYIILFTFYLANPYFYHPHKYI